MTSTDAPDLLPDLLERFRRAAPAPSRILLHEDGFVSFRISLDALGVSRSWIGLWHNRRLHFHVDVLGEAILRRNLKLFSPLTLSPAFLESASTPNNGRFVFQADGDQAVFLFHISRLHRTLNEITDEECREESPALDAALLPPDNASPIPPSVALTLGAAAASPEAAVELIAAGLRRRGAREQSHRRGECCRHIWAKVKSDFTFRCYSCVMPANQVWALRSFLNVGLSPSEHRAGVMEMLLRINAHSLAGGFAMNFEKDLIHVETVLPYGITGLTPAIVDRIVSGNFRMLKRWRQPLTEIMLGAPPEQTWQEELDSGKQDKIR